MIKGFKNNSYRSVGEILNYLLVPVLIFLLLIQLLPFEAYTQQKKVNSTKTETNINILTWDGYITNDDIKNVNNLLKKNQYNFKANIITPYAENDEQMYNLMRNKKVDISFLTLFFVKLQDGKIAKLIQPINTNSPRLSNYKYLLPSLTNIEMGMDGKKPLYIPFAGGSYGFYIDRNKVESKFVPTSWKDLLNPKWKGKYSLNKAQVWYNIAIASMIIGKTPYYLNKLAEQGKRDSIKYEIRDGGILKETLITLYRNAGSFWYGTTSFSPNLQIVSSWGIEIEQLNKKGGNWQIIQFKEGNLVWMDTMNFSIDLEGEKLEAAEIIANYFIGKEVQSRITSELALVSVSSLAKTNPILKNNPKFFIEGTFVPPYHIIADNVMNQLSNDAFKKIETLKNK